MVHVKLSPDPVAPWQGISPLLNAGLSSALLARLELRTGQEAKATVGYVLPMPDGLNDDSLAALKKDLSGLEGSIALVESTAAGKGQGRVAAPPADWRLQRLGAEFLEGNVNLRRQAGADVCNALGVPAALYLASDGTTTREAYRQLLTATLQPLGQLIAEELEAKLEAPIKFNFRRLAAADVAARARSYHVLTAAGMDVERAELLSGLAE